MTRRTIVAIVAFAGGAFVLWWLLFSAVPRWFRGSATPWLSEIREALAAGDLPRVKRVAHTLKSASANVGAEALAALCKEMEHLGRADTTEGADAILTDMEQEFQAVRHSLTAILEKET